jgi:hypothetical protein
MNTKPFAVVTARRTRDAFTLMELLISVAVLTLIIFMLGQLATHSVAVTRTGSKHIDTDTQARAVLDRMALDFAQMLKRTDIDYFVKSPIGYKNPKQNVNPHTKGLKLKVGQQGNDQIAFFSQVPGYNSTGSSSQSPVSLVAYRVNDALPSSPTYLQLERMGKGLLWNGVNNTTSANSPYPIVFLPGQIAAGTAPWSTSWYAAVNNDNTLGSNDPDYETIGREVFRFEYYYLLKDGTIKDIPKIQPPNWDLNKTLSANLNAFSDVEAIAVVIAVIDPASRSLLYDPSNPADPYNRLFNLLSDMADFTTAPGTGVGGAKKIGDVENQWNTALQHAISTGTTYNASGGNGLPFPPAAASGIRIYNRYLDVRTPAQF